MPYLCQTLFLSPSIKHWPCLAVWVSGRKTHAYGVMSTEPSDMARKGAEKGGEAQQAKMTQKKDQRKAT